MQILTFGGITVPLTTLMLVFVRKKLKGRDEDEFDAQQLSLTNLDGKSSSVGPLHQQIATAMV